MFCIQIQIWQVIDINIKDNTSVVVLQHVNSYVDKVRVRMTGRVAYISVGNYK